MGSHESPPIRPWNASEELPPTSKRGIPIWVWLLGCGGAAVVLAVLGAGFFVYRFGRQALDQTKQWEELGKVLPLRGDPPPNFIIGLPTIGGRQVWSMVDSTGVHPAVVVHVVGQEARRERRSVQDPALSSLLNPSTVDPNSQVVESTVVVQSRQLPCVRFRAQDTSDGNDEAYFSKTKNGFRLGEAPKGAFSGPMILVDLTPEGSQDAVLLAFGSPTQDRVSDEEIVDFLAAFRVGADQ